MVPLVSVLILTHNRAGFIEEALNSVLSQGVQELEIIIIDDASTDKTHDIIQRYANKDNRIQYVRNKAYFKIPQSRNIGLSKARGTYVAVLDSDDVWIDRDKLKKQIVFLERHPDHVLVGGGVVVVNEKGVEISKYFNAINDEKVRAIILRKNPFAHSSILFLREAAQKVGGYNESLEVGEDYDFCLKLGAIGKFANLKEYLIRYRIHQGGISQHKKRDLAVNAKNSFQKYRKYYPNYYRSLFFVYLRLFRSLFPF